MQAHKGIGDLSMDTFFLKLVYQGGILGNLANQDNLQDGF